MSIYNGGVDFSFLNRKIHGSIEGFYRQREGIPATRIQSLPSTFGSALPQENLNSLNDRGFELNLGTAGKTGNLSYDLNAIMKNQTTKTRTRDGFTNSPVNGRIVFSDMSLKNYLPARRKSMLWTTRTVP